MVVWGLWLNGAFYFSTGSASRKARNLRENPSCVVCTERAHEAVVVEGKAKLVRDRAFLRGFFKRYEKKYAWDMAEMESEPVFSVEPRVAFGLYEKKYLETVTRWRFPGK
jgi:general stress protein 26